MFTYEQAAACSDYIRTADVAFNCLNAYGPQHVKADAMQYPTYLLTKMAEGVTPHQAAASLLQYLAKLD